MTAKTCSVTGCCKPHSAKGYCSAHYHRYKTHGDPLGGGTPPGEPMRWVNEVALQHRGNDCLMWPFSKSGDGYGMVAVNGKKIVVSRYVCELVHGSPPEPKYQAAHSCGRGHLGCVNPGHLNWKTPKQNKADMLIHGTHCRGERHPKAKLTENDAKYILSLKDSESQLALAERFGVSESTIGKIHTGRNWAWLSEATKEKTA